MHSVNGPLATHSVLRGHNIRGMSDLAGGHKLLRAYIFGSISCMLPVKKSLYLLVAWGMGSFYHILVPPWGYSTMPSLLWWTEIHLKFYPKQAFPCLSCFCENYTTETTEVIQCLNVLFTSWDSELISGPVQKQSWESRQDGSFLMGGLWTKCPEEKLNDFNPLQKKIQQSCIGNVLFLS